MCIPSVVPIVVSTCLRACTAFGMFRPSGVLVVQRCACVCLHSARRVLSEPRTYRAFTVRVSCAVFRGAHIACAHARVGVQPVRVMCSVRHGQLKQFHYCA